MKVCLSLFVCLALCAPGLAQQPDAQTEDHVYSGREVDQRAKMTYRPEPRMTEEARRHRYRGEALLRVVLRADGRVTDIEVMQRAAHGMTEACVAAASGIKFEPALKDGRAVSQYVTIVYHWSIY
ncbi:MAG TPA: energy transducer TonB [Pyrinomonadaceae bacterium]|jgi:TonB family protein